MCKSFNFYKWRCGPQPIFDSQLYMTFTSLKVNWPNLSYHLIFLSNSMKIMFNVSVYLKGYGHVKTQFTDISRLGTQNLTSENWKYITTPRKRLKSQLWFLQLIIYHPHVICTFEGRKHIFFFILIQLFVMFLLFWKVNSLWDQKLFLKYV